MEKQLLAEIRDILKELLEASNLMIQSNAELAHILKGSLASKESKVASSTYNEETNQQFINIENSKENVNVELFKRIVNVYFNEELERIKSNNVRKSARRVSVELGGTMVDFLNHHLQDTGLFFSRLADGLIVIWDKNVEVGAIKVITDIGFHRGEQWFEYVETIVDHCRVKYELENDRVFFVISSLRNGLDQKYVSKILDRDIKSNWEFMNNRKLVDEYVNLFISHTTSLAKPHNQIYVLGSELHPNVIADNLHKMNDEQKKETFLLIEDYEWISDINCLLEEIQNLNK